MTLVTVTFWSTTSESVIARNDVMNLSDNDAVVVDDVDVSVIIRRLPE